MEDLLKHDTVTALCPPLRVLFEGQLLVRVVSWLLLIAAIVSLSRRESEP